MLTSTDDLPSRPSTILIAGVSGVGKTTLAPRIAGMLALPYTELDSLFHGPNWQPRASFLEDVRSLAASDRWITEWQYSAARAMLADRADLLVWLDLPFLTVTLPRVVRRTIRRRVQRIELWNGNIEGPLHRVFTDPEHIVRWAWRTRRKYTQAIPRLAETHPNLTVVRLRSPRDVEEWLVSKLQPLAPGDRPDRAR